MKTNLLSTDRKKIIITVLIIASLQAVFAILSFNTLKTGYEGDEVYSYATANSSQTLSPLLDMNGIIHINQWLSPEKLFQAVTVSRNELFDYRHINEILNNDAHPPLYFWILHFFCSFFEGRFSWIPSVIINSLSIFIGQIFFYRMFLILSENRFSSLLGMTFYGCTTAMINMMNFTRNYTLLTSLTLIYAFYIFRSVRQRALGEKNTKSILLAAVFLYLASMTQYIAVIFGFFITLTVCIYYLLKKDFRFLLKTGLSMAGAIAMMIISFHQVLHQLTIDQTSMENASDYPFALELRVALHVLFNELFGINTPVSPSMIPFWTFWGLTGVFIIYLIMRILFRTDEWFLNFRRKIRDKGKSILAGLGSLRSLGYFSLFVTVTAVIMIVSYNFKMYYYYPNCNRYLFILYPYVIMLVLVPLFRLLKYVPACILLAIGLSFLSLHFGTKTNIGHPGEPSLQEVSRTLQDADVLVIVPDYYAANNSILYLEKCNQVFYTTEKMFDDNISLFARGLSKNKTLYMIYYWPAFANEDTNTRMLNILKELENAGITTINDNRQNFGAKPIAGVGGHALFRLR